MAAVVACGQGAFLSHPDAAVLWGFYDRIGPRIHVTVKWRRSVEGLVIHRTRRLDPDEVTTRNGIPVTTVARTFVDLTDCINEDRLLRAMREAEFKNLLDLDSLNAAVERAHGRRRLTPLKRAIALHRPGQIVRGELEHRFAELRRGSGLREPADELSRSRRAAGPTSSTATGPSTGSPSSWTAATRTRARWPSSQTGAGTPPSMQSACGSSASRGSA